MKKIFEFLLIFIILIPLLSLSFSDIVTISTENDISTTTTSFSSTVDFSVLSYVAFGDSITYGADYTRSYAQMDNPYPELVCQKLGLLSYDNRGVSGATFCSNDLNRVCMTNNILAYTENADIISVMLGVNDCLCGLPLGSIGDTTNSTIYGSLNLIADYLTTHYENSFVFFMTPYKSFRKSVSYELIDVVNAVKEVAFLYGIPVLDMYNEGKYELEMYNASSDGLHPSQEFVERYTAPQIANFIKQNYK